MSSDYIPHQLIWRTLADGTSAPVIDPYVNVPRLIGKLQITIHKAQSLWRTVLVGKMDPYVECKYQSINQSIKKRTSIHKKGDIAPIWEESVEFDVHDTGDQSINQSIKFKVLSKTMLSSNLIGYARVPLVSLILLHGLSISGQSINCANVDSHTCWIELGREARGATAAGALLISLRFTPSNPADVQSISRLSLTTVLPPSLNAALQQSDERQDRASSISEIGTPSYHEAARGSVIRPGSMTHSRVASINQPMAAATAYNQSINQSITPTNQSINPILNSHGKPRLFGGPLSNGLARSKSCVPVVVYVCVQYLLYHGLSSVGLFRISGSSVIVDSIKAAFESGESVQISDPHATAAVLKSYFRELSEPLIPNSLTERFLQAVDSVDQNVVVQRLTACVNQLPDENRVVLSFLLHFLTKVSQHESENRMNARNLAVVWSPNLLRCPATDQQTMAREMHRAEECLLHLIQHYNLIFREGPPKPFSLQHPQMNRPQVAAQRATPTQRSDVSFVSQT